MYARSIERIYCNRCLTDKPAADFSEVAKAQAKAGDPLAMCQQCVNYLFTSRLSRSEVDGYLAEDEDRRLARQRLKDQELMKNAPARMGRTLPSSELIVKLSRLIPGFKVQPGGVVGDLSFYRDRNGQIDALGWVTEGIVPEYSIVHTDARDIPIREQRGWRTVLLRLIKAGVLTEAQCNREFGQPSNGEQSRLWREELWNHRQDRTFA